MVASTGVYGWAGGQAVGRCTRPQPQPDRAGKDAAGVVHKVGAKACNVTDSINGGHEQEHFSMVHQQHAHYTGGNSKKQQQLQATPTMIQTTAGGPFRSSSNNRQHLKSTANPRRMTGGEGKGSCMLCKMATTPQRSLADAQQPPTWGGGERVCVCTGTMVSGEFTASNPCGRQTESCVMWQRGCHCQLPPASQQHGRWPAQGGVMP